MHTQLYCLDTQESCSWRTKQIDFCVHKRNLVAPFAAFSQLRSFLKGRRSTATFQTLFWLLFVCKRQNRKDIKDETYAIYDVGDLMLIPTFPNPNPNLTIAPTQT